MFKYLVILISLFFFSSCENEKPKIYLGKNLTTELKKIHIKSINGEKELSTNFKYEFLVILQDKNATNLEYGVIKDNNITILSDHNSFQLEFKEGGEKRLSFFIRDKGTKNILDTKDILVEVFNSCLNDSGMYIKHLDKDFKTFYQQEYVTYDNKCKSKVQTRVCNNGIWGSWDGEYAFSSCNVLDNIFSIQHDILWQIYGANQEEKEQDLKFLIEKIKELNIKRMRIFLRWSALYEVPNIECSQLSLKSNVLDKYKNVIDMLPQDIELSVVLDTPPKACRDLFAIDKEGFAQSFRKYASEISNAFKDRIKVWELWIEPNNNPYYLAVDENGTAWSAKDYVDYILKPGYEAIKEVDSNLLVSSAGLVFDGVSGHIDNRGVQPPKWWSKERGLEYKWYVIPNFLEDMYKAGAKDYMDFINIHPFFVLDYPNALGMEEGVAEELVITQKKVVDPLWQVNRAREVMKRYNDETKEIWLDPVGVAVDEVGSEEERFRLLNNYIKKLLSLDEYSSTIGPIRRLNFYTLRDTPTKVAGGVHTKFGALYVNNITTSLFSWLQTQIRGYGWYVTNWSECVNNKRYRDTFCIDREFNEVNSSYCNFPTPILIEDCNSI